MLRLTTFPFTNLLWVYGIFVHWTTLIWVSSMNEWIVLHNYSMCLTVVFFISHLYFQYVRWRRR